MTTRFRELSTKFHRDSVHRAQIIGRGVKQSIDFLDFSAKKGSYDTIIWRHIFSHLSIKERFPAVAKHNRTKFGGDPKRGSRFPKNIHWQTSKKTSFKQFFSFF